ncbi:hypothetical protein FQN52_004348 [Onygenales sp. PD_12]|nr:hypothetical protein FQN52_004348 [Onygenales sp. PD_12]
MNRADNKTMTSPDIFQFPQYWMLRQKHSYFLGDVKDTAAPLFRNSQFDSRAGAPTIAIMMTLSELLVDLEANDLQAGRRKSHTS